MDALIAAWARAIVLTELVEVPIYLRVGRVSFPLAFGASAITHPIVWFGFFSPRLALGYETRLVAAELFAVGVEAALLATRLPPARALGVSTLANLSSVVVGAICRAITGFP